MTMVVEPPHFEAPEDVSRSATPPAGRVTEIGDVEVVDGGKRWGSLAIGLVALVALTWIAVASLGSRLGVEDDLAVPDILVADYSGRPVAKAQRAVERAGLVADIQTAPNDLDEFPVGTVFSQRPADGTKLAAGSGVTLIVSSGPSQFVVPDVTGQQLPEAQKLILDTGLFPKPIAEYSEQVRVGEVIETRPRAGTEAAQLSVVEIVVSAGYAPRRVPKMVGKPAEKALNLLGRSGLGAGEIDAVYRRDAEIGTVLSVDPGEGTVLPRNSAVNVLIAGPPPVATVPSVEGLSEDEAYGSLANAGLDVRVLSIRVPIGSPDDGRVVSQGVPPQAEVAPGFTVEIIVGKAPPPPTTTAPPTTAPPPTTTPAPTTAPSTTAVTTTLPPTTTTAPSSTTTTAAGP